MLWVRIPPELPIYNRMRTFELFYETFDIEDHLKSRGIDMEKTHVVFDTKTNTATFFLYNISGQLVGYQYYNPHGSKSLDQKKADRRLMKYYTYVTGQKDEKRLAVWGLESYDMKSSVLFVVEGIFDAVKIQNAGYPAIAILSNDPRQDLKTWLKTLPQTIIAVLDRDDNSSGNKLASTGDRSTMTPAPYKDLGDMPQEEVNTFIKQILGNSR